MSTLNGAVNSLQVGPGLVQVKAVGGNVPSVITPIEFYSLQSASFDIDQKIVSASGSMKMPFDSAPVDMTIKGTLEMLELKGAVFSNIISGDNPSTGGNVESYKEAFTLTSKPVTTLSAVAFAKGDVVTDGTTIGVCTVAGTPAAFTLPTTLGAALTSGGATFVSVCLDTGAPTNACALIVAQAQFFAEDEGVQYQANNNPLATLGGAQGLTPLPAPPAVGQYICAGTTGVYLFNATDATSVFVTYTWTSATLVNTFPIMNHWIGWGPICEVNIQFPYQSVDTQHVLVGLHLLAVRFGSQKTKTKRDGYMTVTYDFEAFAPPNGLAGQLYLPN
jgi:uncharacterized Zn-binding protein involved in type VI secretion